MKRALQIEEARLLNFARRYLSEAFPNPQRMGCPTQRELRLMALQPQRTNESVSDHLTFCSPCFNRYMDLLAELRQERQTQKRPLWTDLLAWVKTSPAWIGSTVMVVGLISMVAYFGALPRERPKIPAPPRPVTAPSPMTFTPFTLDLRELSPTRGSKSRKAGSHRLPGARLDLTLILPLGSEQQSYRMTLRSGDEVLWSHFAQAQLRDGQMLIRTEADLRLIPPGSYTLEVESTTGIRLTQPVLIGAALPASKEQK